MQLIFSSGKKPIQGPTRREMKLLIMLMVFSILMTLHIGSLAFVIALSASHRGRPLDAAAWMLMPLAVWIGSVAFFRYFMSRRKTVAMFLAAIFPLVFFLVALAFFVTKS